MKLYILRHGKAGDGFPDSVRELTEKGYRQVESVVESRAAELGEVELYVTSPYRRAEQTLEHALKCLGAEVRFEVSENLTPGANPSACCEELSSMKGESILVASHQPFVSSLVYYLTGESIEMSTGTLAAIEADVLEEGWGRLLWIEKPFKKQA